MKRISLLFIAIIIVLAVSCSGSFQNADDSVSAFLISAMNEAIDKSMPSTTNEDGSSTYIIDDFRAENGAVISGTITVDASGNIISATLEEFVAGGETGRYEAETDDNGKLTSSIATVEKINILIAEGKPLVSSPGFSTDFFVVEVTYTDDSTRTLDGDGLVTPEYDWETDGSSTWNGIVEASYGGKTVKKLFILPEDVMPPSNGEENSITYKQLRSLTIYQTTPATDGEAFNPSYFELEVEYADGLTEIFIGNDCVELQEHDGTMNKGDYVIASFSNYQVLLRIDFID